VRHVNNNIMHTTQQELLANVDIEATIHDYALMF